MRAHADTKTGALIHARVLVHNTHTHAHTHTLTHTHTHFDQYIRSARAFVCQCF